MGVLINFILPPLNEHFSGSWHNTYIDQIFQFTKLQSHKHHSYILSSLISIIVHHVIKNKLTILHKPQSCKCSFACCKESFQAVNNIFNL